MKRINKQYKKNGNMFQYISFGLLKLNFSIMERKFRLIYLISFLLIFATSCKDYLELKPQDNLVQDEFWQNKEQVNSAVAACYASMNEKDYMDRVISWGELRAEMLVSVAASSDQQNMMKGFNKVSSSLSNWASFYTTINYCNVVLAYGSSAQQLDPTFSEDLLKIYEGEALAIRALSYLILVKNFKEVPLVLTATLNDQTDFYVSKEKESVIIAQIISDLKTALEALPAGYSQSAAYDKGRMTKGAALSILADTYLWSFQYDNCIDACKAITDLNKYSLVNGSSWFDELFFQGNSSEGIFELQFDALFTTLKNYFYVSNPDFTTYSYMEDLFPTDGTDKRGHLASYSRTNSAIFKFAGVDPVGGTYRSDQQFYNNWIFYRYADVMLMQAEAYLMSSTQQNLNRAYDLINAVYERANGAPLEIDVTISDLETALLLERQKEFAFEAKRWYDLLRFARRNNFQGQDLILEMADLKTDADNYEEILSNYADTASYFLPIYSEEIFKNPNLEQNPYYEY
jgi:hypothetical protein